MLMTHLKFMGLLTYPDSQRTLVRLFSAWLPTRYVGGVTTDQMYSYKRSTPVLLPELSLTSKQLSRIQQHFWYKISMNTTEVTKITKI